MLMKQGNLNNCNIFCFFFLVSLSIVSLPYGFRTIWRVKINLQTKLRYSLCSWIEEFNSLSSWSYHTSARTNTASFLWGFPVLSSSVNLSSFLYRYYQTSLFADSWPDSAHSVGLFQLNMIWWLHGVFYFESQMFECNFSALLTVKSYPFILHFQHVPERCFLPQMFAEIQYKT